ncbi:MAG: hypothetical protein ABI333_20485 [bacterium]
MERHEQWVGVGRPSWHYLGVGLRIWLILVAFMVLGVPWFFTGSGPSPTVLGLPDWAAYSLGISLLNAAVAAWLISRYWDALAGDEGADDDADADDDDAAGEDADGEPPDGEPPDGKEADGE